MAPLSPSGDGLLADLFLGRPRSRRYPKFNIRRDIPQAIRAWCNFAIGLANSDVQRLSQAAAAYAAVPVSLPSNVTLWLKILPLIAAGNCYLLADKPELAEPLFKKCIDAMPESHIFRKRFTECLIRQNKKSEALAAFADYDRLQPDANDTRWLSPLVLKVGSAWEEPARPG